MYTIKQAEYFSTLAQDIKNIFYKMNTISPSFILEQFTDPYKTE